MARRQGLTDEQISRMLDQNCESWFDDSDDQSDLGSFDAHSEKDYHFPDEFGQDDSQEEEAISMELDDFTEVFLLDQSPMRLRPLQSQDLAPVHGSIPTTSSLVPVHPSTSSDNVSLNIFSNSNS